MGINVKTFFRNFSTFTKSQLLKSNFGLPKNGPHPRPLSLKKGEGSQEVMDGVLS